MNVTEIIAKVDEALQDKTISPTLAEVNSAVGWIASISFLPELATKGVAKFASITNTVAGATNATPIVITTAAAHGLSMGMVVVVADIVGNIDANNTWFIEVLSDTTFSLLQSVGLSDYVSGGTAVKRDDYADMPDDYDHDLFEAYSISQVKKVNIRSNQRTMGTLYTIDGRIATGEIADVAVAGTRLYGLPISAKDDVIMCKYYRKPTAMTLLTESPHCVPAHLHEDLIVSYILVKKWPLIEDAFEGKRPNTDKAIAVFNGGLAALQRYYPRPSTQQPIRNRTFQYF